MKSLQKLILLAIIIILICVIALMYFYNNSYQQQQTSTPHEEFNLLEVKSDHHPFEDTVYGQITSKYKMAVKMKVSGKIDSDNHKLTTGTTFKKNDLLIKIDRLSILYELLMARSDYKRLVNKSIREFPAPINNKKEKWERFYNKIHKTHAIPPLPESDNKEEENYLSQSGIFTQYYKIKKLELSAEQYIYAAPFDGVIIKSFVYPGAEIKKNTPLMYISKQGSSEVKVNIPISRVQDYKRKDSVRFLGSASDTLGYGTLLRVSEYSTDSSTVEMIYSITPQSNKNLGEVVRVVPLKEKITKNVGIPKRLFITIKS